MREDLVLDYAGVVHHVHLLDGHGGNLGDEDAAERVGDGWGDAAHLEHHLLIVHVRDPHLEVFAEGLHGERVVDAHRGVRARVLVLGGVPVLVGAACHVGSLALDVSRDLLEAGGVLGFLLRVLLGARHGSSRTSREALWAAAVLSAG